MKISSFLARRGVRKFFEAERKEAIEAVAIGLSLPFYPEGDREFFKKIEKEHKKIDILVNVVGQSEPGGPVEIDSPTWQKQFALNLDTAYFCIKFAIPIMEKAAKLAKDGQTYIILGSLYLSEDKLEEAVLAIEEGLKKGKVKNSSQARLTLGQAHFELQNFDQAKKEFRIAARNDDKKIKKTANSWIKYTENEEIRVKNLALRRDYIQNQG